jgi:hypothetical protein
MSHFTEVAVPSIAAVPSSSGSADVSIFYLEISSN